MSAEWPDNAREPQAQEQAYPVMPPHSAVPQPGMDGLPPVTNDRTNFALLGALLIALSTIFLPQGIATFVESRLPLLARVGALLFFYSLPILMVTCGILALIQARRWEVVNRHRQMAAAWGLASGIPLVEPRPVSPSGALPPHFTIKLKTNWFAVVALACLVVGIVLLIWLDFSVPFGILLGEPFWESISYAWHFSFFPVIPLIFALSPVILLVRSSWSQRIEVTPEGVAVRDGWSSNRQQVHTQVILWHEARLFALRGGKPGASTIRYELSGPTTVVTFRRILQPHFWSRFQPAQPFGDYQAQMDALLALISARTGLALHDVRQAPGEGTPPVLGSPANYRTVLSAVLMGLSFYAQVEGFPGVLFAQVHNDGRPVALVLEIIAGLLALGSVWFGHRLPRSQARRVLLGLGYLFLALAVIGLMLYPFGPFVH
jgi:hypothetical protein